ncbi:MAG: GNAT family N-acetyltransferase [Chloroflexaceae bacterium]|jgi:ribosomal protein S18 acetylase RimI-like enzyme|nr:GNAT family N-acetyltransferase [Chloroflexaceae bacterium]
MTLHAHNWTITPATPADEWAVQRLFGALHAYNTSLDSRFALGDGWEHVLHEHLCHVAQTGLGLTLLAWHHGDDGSPPQPVGLLMMGAHTDTPLFKHRRWAELLAIYIEPLARGSSLAEDLVELGAGWAHQQGYERVQLYVTASNERAKRFYTHHGFQPVQEIWRRELGAVAHHPPDDPAAESHFAHGDDLLSVHPHQIHAGEEPCES